MKTFTRGSSTGRATENDIKALGYKDMNFLRFTPRTNFGVELTPKVTYRKGSEVPPRRIEEPYRRRGNGY